MAKKTDEGSRIHLAARLNKVCDAVFAANMAAKTAGAITPEVRQAKPELARQWEGLVQEAFSAIERARDLIVGVDLE